MAISSLDTALLLVPAALTTYYLLLKRNAVMFASLAAYSGYVVTLLWGPWISSTLSSGKVQAGAASLLPQYQIEVALFLLITILLVVALPNARRSARWFDIPVHIVAATLVIILAIAHLVPAEYLEMGRERSLILQILLPLKGILMGLPLLITMLTELFGNGEN